jgi:hypothetical protein
VVARHEALCEGCFSYAGLGARNCRWVLLSLQTVTACFNGMNFQNPGVSSDVVFSEIQV